MSKRDDGGPAFPLNGGVEQLDSPLRLQGMTLRDYFAAKAMQGMLACPQQPHSGLDMYARDAYAIADAMLKERDK